MAVRLMAEMAGLRPVRVGNTLFVCSKASAKELREDPDLYPPQPKVTPDGVVLPPGAVFPPGVNPFGPGMVLPGIGGGPGLPAVPARERAPMVEAPPPPPPPMPPKEERREEPRPDKPGDR
jgi:hypothetical protein